MKCPKCNYTSFDFNRVCPKCGNNTTKEQTRLNLLPNKPNPPFFLTSLIGREGSVNLEIPSDGVHISSSGATPKEMDAQELLISLDDFHAGDVKLDSPEPLDTSTDEIIFGTNDSKEDTLEPFDAADDEILFDLELESGEDEIKSVDGEPLEKEGFSGFDGPDKKRIAVDTEEIQEKTEDKTDEVDLFLADEPALVLDEKASVDTKNKLGAANSQEVFLSLDDLPDSESKPDSSASTRIEEDEIELKEPLSQETAPSKKDTSDEKDFWNSDEIEKQVAAFDLEETADEKKEVNLFSDLDIEPLDLELSLNDMEKKP